ncbi:four-carbon acid sugar kinase family protein [Kiloniella sp.]|uniref:four-carbon acid sugar kinase family protein n=1 Tax=Kiloniella sp. TaxID=1938587 RepID=UPI003A938C8E
MKKINPKCSPILIVADDLTSAADGAAPFLQRGLNATVHRWGQDAFLKASKGVIAIDCNSRSMNETAAALVVGQAIKEASDSAILLKTIDSTLRGNIKAELKAAFESAGRKKIVIAPAFPEAGRTTQNGVQFINGTPVFETSYANDPVHPVRTSQVSDLIPDKIEDVKILDAETQNELNEQVAAFENPEDILWVGSPGIAIALAAALFAKQVTNSTIPYAGNSLVVVGSANPISQQQAKYVQNKTDITCLSVPEERSKGSAEVLHELTLQAARLIQSGRYDALIATGGDTMDALLKELDIGDFSLVGEFEPGFPLGIARLASGKNIVLAMKAGGFGEGETLLRATKQLTKQLRVPNVQLSKVI